MPRGVSPYDEAQLQGRLWTPALLRGSGLQLWHDVSDLSTITAASNAISALADKSGLGRTATGTNKPTLAYNVINGLSAMKFNGSNSDLAPSAFTVPQPLHVFQVMRTGVLGNNGEVSFGGGDAANFYIEPSRNGSFPLTTNGFTNQLNIGSVSANNNYIWGMYANGASSSGRLNGKVTTGNVGANGISAMHYSLASPNNWDGWIAETIIVSNSPALADVIDGYLAWKWGIPLPASHRFANRPPLIGG